MIAIEARSVSRMFGAKVALRQVSLEVRPGAVDALLGPNGAGKTTLLRILAGLTDPTEGSIRVLGYDPARADRALRRLIGLIPAGDRTFYHRLSGLENLVFFARLQGLSRRQAVARAHEVLDGVGLTDSMHLAVGKCSHGMQKRLSIARALLMAPPVLLVDEATHDLDPEGARQVRSLIRAAAGRGAAIVWATQRVDEIRGFADTVTLLANGAVRFAGTVPQLMSHSAARRFVLRVTNGRATGDALEQLVQRAVDTLGEVTAAQPGDAEHYVLRLADGVVLGDAIAALAAADVRVQACREELSEVEEAFLRLTEEDEP